MRKQRKPIAVLLHLTPIMADAYYNLGTALVEQGRHEEAEVNYRQAEELGPNLVAP